MGANGYEWVRMGAVGYIDEETHTQQRHVGSHGDMHVIVNACMDGKFPGFDSWEHVTTEQVGTGKNKQNNNDRREMWCHDML